MYYDLEIVISNTSFDLISDDTSNPWAIHKPLTLWSWQLKEHFVNITENALQNPMHKKLSDHVSVVKGI